jgi:hypothetical protein
VWSDKADYAPGEQVTLSGANWAAGESVHIRVNDDAGETWRRDVDVTADENGAISDQFNLPDWFVAQYSVTATGASSGTATWTFTDSQVGNITGAASVNEGGSGSYSAQISGCNTNNPCGYTWSITQGNATIASGGSGSVTSTTTVTAGVNFGDGPSSVNLRIRATGGANGNESISNLAITVNNVAPTVTITGNATPDEGSTENYDYSAVDPGGDTFSFGTPSCGTGTLVQYMPAQQRFRCRFTNGPASTSVSIPATDDDSPGLTGTGTLAISVQNVNPTVTAPPNQTATQGQSASINVGSFTDPGAESSWSVTVNWGDGSTNDTFSVSAAGSLGSRAHTYATTGSKTVTVTVNDGTGSGQAQFTVTVVPADAIAPTTTATPSPAANGAGWNNTNVSVNLSATDNAGGSGVKEITYSAAGAQSISSTTVSGASAGPISITAEGTTTVSFFAADNAGNTESTKTLVVKIDKTQPDTTITVNPSNPSNSASASFSFAGSDPGGSGVASFECKLDAAAFAACTSPKTYFGLADGSHTFQVRATDAAGNTDASPASFTWVVDTAAPDTVIDSTPANPTNSTSASFMFHSTETGSTFECKLDGGPFAACTSPKNYSSLSEASHTFQVRGTDSAGNTDLTPASFTWTVDTTPPPVPTFGSGPLNPSNDPSPSFTFSDTEAGVTLLCRLDGTDPDPYAPCTSPKSFSGLADGSHTFLIKARDAAGNVSGANAYTWVIDTVAPPTPTIDSAPASLTNDKSPSFEFSDSEAGVSFLCDLDGAGYSACTSPKDYSDQADGEHTFSVKAKDAAGNTSAAATHTWTIDATPPPAPVITDAPSGLSNDSSPTFTFTEAEAGTSLYCQLDYAGYVPCSSPQEYTGVADGEHTFLVKAVDAAGNEAATFMTWTIDATPPTLTASAVKGTEPLFGDATPYLEDSWTNEDVKVSYACVDNVGGSGVAPGDPTPAAETFTTEGTHTSASDCSDNAGNSVHEEFGVKLDKTPPTITATLTPAPNANGFNNTDVTVTYACSDALSGLNTAYGDGVTGCPSDEHVSAEGLTTIHRGIFDNAGNGTQSAVDVRIDKTKPSSSASSPAFNNTATIHVTYTASDNAGGSGLDSVELWVKGPSDSGYAKVATDATPGASGSFDYAVPTAGGDLVDGTYRFYTIAVDKAGNSESTPSTPDGATTQTVQDSVAPDTSITSQPSNPSNSSSPSFSFTYTDASPSSGLKRFECNLDGAGFTTCSSPKSYSSLGEGSHTFQVRAVDNADNTDATPASFTWFVDTVAPDTIIDTHPSDPTNSASASFSFHASDPSPSSGIAGFQCKLDSGSYAPCTSPQNYSALADGSHTFSVKASDSAGNTDASPDSFTWLVDTVKPVISGSQSPLANGDGWNNTNVTVSFSCADVGANASGIDINTVAGATLTHEGRNQSATNTGVCKDKAGNEADTATVSGIKIDKTGPNPPSGHTDHGPEYSSGGTNWYKDSVVVSFTSNGDPDLEDLTAGSGVASVTASQTFSSAGPFSKTGKATDQAGNYSAGTTVSGNVDTAKPVVNLTCPTSVILGSSASGTWTASDPGEANAASGIAPGVGSGSIALNTSTIGPHYGTVPAGASKDNVGHFSDASNECSYNVTFSFTGFFAPVDNNDVCNVVKAGSAVPIKFSLHGYQGMNIFQPGYPKVIAGTCAGMPLDSVEETVTAGGSSLNYDSTADQYIYVWKTDKAWAGKAMRFEFYLADGSYHYARFTFTK